MSSFSQKFVAKPTFYSMHRLTRALRQVCLASAALLITQHATAGVAVLQPPKVVDANQAFSLTLLISADDQGPYSYAVPDHVMIKVTADMLPPVAVRLERGGDIAGQLTLQQGEFRKVTYSAILPRHLRGVVRIETVDIDTSSMLVALVRPRDGEPLMATPDDLINMSRVSLNEPMYFIAGNSGGYATAKFQLSFKFRLFQPDDMRSRSLLDNLYLGYTQYSIWDLQKPSAPFRDTNYRPSLYYFLPDVGIHNSVINRMALATGIEHESNGRDSIYSRSLDVFFVQPSWSFGKLDGYQLLVSPKLYAYLGSLPDNPDLAHYRGHMDLRLALGKPDGFELATTLRKGTRSNYGSANTSLSYPLSQLLPGTAGYVMAGLFYGYGESLLTYNQKLTTQFRVGYSISR